MSNSRPPRPEGEAQDETESKTAMPEAEVGNDETAPGREAAATAGTEDPITKLEAEVSSLKDQLLRALAETENVRRRSQRERAETAKYAAGPLAKDIFSVADNLERALESVPKGAAEDDPHLKSLIEGVHLTQKELAAALDRHDITKVDPLGERLDPHKHEAMFEIEDPSKPAGTVAQVLQPGYLLHDRLLRPARVGVAKGGPAPGANDNSNKDGDPAPEPGSHLDTEV